MNSVRALHCGLGNRFAESVKSTFRYINQVGLLAMQLAINKRANNRERQKQEKQQQESAIYHGKIADVSDSIPKRGSCAFRLIFNTRRDMARAIIMHDSGEGGTSRQRVA